MKFKKLVILFALFLPGLAWPITASAHTSLISQTPVGNSVIEVLPSEVALTFDESLIVIGNSNVITVLDPMGTEITTGDTKVNNNVVSRTIASSQIGGKYSVTYRVVSEDGHVVSSTYQFTLETNASTATTEAESLPTVNESESPMPISNIEAEPKTESNSHTNHSFWGDHAGHIYIFLGALFLIFAWKKYAK
jgi:methionine-rich copper-binding protein CopC